MTTLIDCFNQFWREFRKKEFSPNETLLYFYLLDVWNNTGRKEQFECKTNVIEITLGMNKMTITRCREKLKSRGLISFVNGSTRGKYPHYSMCHVTDDVTDDVTIHRVIRVKEKEDTSNEASKKTARKPVEINFDEVMNSYNEMLSPPFPRCTKMTTARRSAIKSRVSEHGINSVITVFQKVKDSQFLNGKKWCGFDWIFKPANYIKILEGNYDNNGASNNKTNGQLRVNSGAVQDQSIDIYKEVFGYDGPPDKFEEWFTRKPYGG